MWQKIALILIGLGVLVLVGWTVQVFLTDPEVHLLIKIAIMAVGAGILILIGVVVKDRLTKAKTEDFKEVDN
jgi:hypothetical protein